VKEKEKLQKTQVNNFAHSVYLSSYIIIIYYYILLYIIQKPLLFIQKFALPWQKFNTTFTSEKVT